MRRFGVLLLAVLVPGAPGWAAETPAPRTVPGLMLWLDAADGETLELQAGRVHRWRDKSGRERHLVQPRLAARPTVRRRALNGRRAVAFDGARHFLAGPAVLPAGCPAYTLFVLWRPRQSAGSQSVFEQAAVPLAGHTRAALLAVNGHYGFNGEGNDRHDLVPFTPNAWRLTCLEVDPARARNIRVWDNGLPFAGATTDPQALRLGADGVALGRKLATDGEYLHGEVAEVLVYDRCLRRAERQAVLAYLDDKWGLGCLGWLRGPDGQPLAFDFEGDDYEGWGVEGTAFGSAPAPGTLPGQMEVTGFLGAGLANSYHGGDVSTGTLTSPPFVIERRYLRFLIGGGKYPGQACLNLLVDGQVVRTATGPNDRPGGSERLDWQQWDVAALVGKTATLQIVDQATSGWGHINVDHIFQTDERLPALVDQEREFVATRRFLNLPVKDGAPERRLRVVAGGKVARDFVIPLADDTPDYWVFLDLLPFRGQRLTLRGERLPENSRGLALAAQSNTIRGSANLYRERLRPQFHFTTRRGWSNDPNGLVYHAGEWHLFYQHNPYSTRWENMHWGHAVSRDLVHWTELPVALYPDALGTCFSGSAVVDEQNTTGFGRGTEPPLVCIFTAAGSQMTQCLAYSLDRGRTWTNYAGNPVLSQLVAGNRDPKVIWDAPRRRWIMALYLDGSDFALFSSPDLKRWEKLSTVTIPGTSECPEFFEIPVQGRPGETRWIFYGGNGRYLVGRFDGRTFTPESGPHALHHGNCFYASQTFNGAPDGRRVLIAWGTVSLPGMPFNQMMDFPVELTLRPTEEGLRLFANPVRELASLHARAWQWQDLALPAGERTLPGVKGELLHLQAELEVGDATALGLTVRGVPITYDAKAQRLTCAGSSAPLKPEAGRIRLEVLVDRASVEVFANDGRVYLPVGVLPAVKERGVALFAREGTARVHSLRVWCLRSIWTGKR